jgi:hypothetical protein
MSALLVAMMLAAQALPTLCPDIVQELKMRPPAYGDQSRAQELWDRYLEKCERQMDFPLSTEDENEVSQVLRSEPSK